MQMAERLWITRQHPLIETDETEVLEAARHLTIIFHQMVRKIVHQVRMAEPMEAMAALLTTENIISEDWDRDSLRELGGMVLCTLGEVEAELQGTMEK